MLIESLALDDLIKKVFIEIDGINELYPPQTEAINRGLLEGKNLVIAIPTAAGKTLLAELAALKHVVEMKGKVIYLCPLRALASEKFSEFKRFTQLGIRVAVTSGDYDSNDSYLSRYDIIVSTNEKMDALLRHRASWIAEQVSLVIVDECHLLDDQHRGPTLETLLARLLMENTSSQIIALSATVGNADELAEWLNAELVQSEWRPVPLKEGVYFNDQVTYSDFSSREIPFRRKDPLVNITLDSLHAEEQILIFTPSRRSAVATAEKIGKIVESSIKPREAKRLNEISSQAVTNLSDPLSLKLAETIKRGVTFHHAGLNSQQRELVETAFKKGFIKALCATPTLCLSQDTMIWHGTTQTQVSHVKSSDPVLALSGTRLILVNTCNVQVFENFSNLIEIKSVSGYSIKVTPNHKMLIKRNKEKIILPAKMIKQNDRIATIGKLNIENPYIYYLKDFVKDNETNVGNYEFDASLSYFIGLMLGDGHSGAELVEDTIVYKGSPSIVNIDEEILNYCKNICQKLELNSRRTKSYYEVPTLVMGKNKWFREFLVRCGVDIKDKKHISEKLMKMSLNNVSSLLKGLFDTDGYVNKGKGVGFGNSSEILIKQMQKLLLRFGIVTRLRNRKASTIKIYEKEYKTNPSFELIIAQKQCLLKFEKSIGFGHQRKQKDFTELINQIKSNFHYIFCPNCEYKIYKDLFSGRTNSQKKWGKAKLDVIKLLGKKGELGSREIKKTLGFEPRKNERRLNHHYELITKRKIGKISNNEWFWRLNSIGDWIFNNLLINNKKNFEDFFDLEYCPSCNHALESRIKRGWRDSDIEGDIFWDVVRTVKKVRTESSVYDLVLPDNPKNNHMFVANGFIVHNSAGINVPAKRVVVSSVYRYSVEQGSHPIKTLEYKQMCLPEKSLVLTPTSEVEIQSLGKGDRVIGYSNNGELVHDEVLEVFERDTDTLINLKTSLGVELVGTPEHPVWTTSGWKNLGELNDNDEIAYINKINLGKRGNTEFPFDFIKIKSVERLNKRVKVYNIQTRRTNTFFANNFLVHNCGRAGRPQFDTEGESILLAKQERVLHWLMDRYILRDSEAVYSKLAAKPALRRNILGLIASRVVRTVPDLLNFFEKTFYGFQFEAALLEGKIREVIDLFIIWEMINPLDANETLDTTRYGLRVSQLYLDPETAASLVEGLSEAVKKSQKKFHSVAFLDLIVGTPDMIELSFRKRDEKKTEERLNRFKPRLIRNVPDSLDIEYDFRLHDFKTVLFLWDWINEIPIEQIIMRYNIGSGDIKRVVDTATWLMSALNEISALKARENSRYKIFTRKTQSLSERVRYGIKKDAISLTQVKGIGRKRARVLLDHGIRDVSKLLALDVSKLIKIPGFGRELAKSILSRAKELDSPKKEKNAESSETDVNDYIF